MKLGAEAIQETAATLGSQPDSVEKVFRLLSLLSTLRSNAFLRPRVALKGGTALNCSRAIRSCRRTSVNSPA